MRLVNVPGRALVRLKHDLFLDAHSGQTPQDLAMRLSRYAATLDKLLHEAESGFRCGGCGRENCDEYRESADGIALCGDCYRAAPISTEAKC